MRRFFAGKTALVTGGGSGIGRALALSLAEAGCKAVLITDLREERLDPVVEEVKARGSEGGSYKVDHSRPEEVESLARRFFADWGRLDVLCCNAGVGMGARFLEMTLEDWEWVIGTNLWGLVYTLHFFLPRMVEQGGGSVLISASDAGLFAIPGMAAYQASKYAAVGLGETLRMELYEKNVKVSVLCPGFVRTNIVKNGRIRLYDRHGRSARASLERFYEKRGVAPEVVARAGLRALEKDRGIVLAPWTHSGPQYVLKRISPGLYHSLFRFLWRKGYLHRLFGAEP